MDLQIISGTNRPGNLSIGVARQYAQLLNEGGVNSNLFSLESLPGDFLSTDLYGNRSQSFLEINQQILSTPHLLFVVPEYNGSIPGILKLFIDACDYPQSFRNKEVWMVGLSAGRSGNRVGCQHLSDIMNFLGSKVHEEQLLLYGLKEKVGEDGWVNDPESRKEVETHAQRIQDRIITSGVSSKD